VQIGCGRFISLGRTEQRGVKFHRLS
jgi:hypothetical protein